MNSAWYVASDPVTALCRGSVGGGGMSSSSSSSRQTGSSSILSSFYISTRSSGGNIPGYPGSSCSQGMASSGGSSGRGGSSGHLAGNHSSGGASTSHYNGASAQGRHGHDVQVCRGLNKWCLGVAGINIVCRVRVIHLLTRGEQTILDLGAK